MNSNRYQNYSIELDCPPGNPRPWELIDGVLADTGLTVDDFDTGAPFFGHQTWVLKDGDTKRDRLFRAMKPTLKQRIVGLRERGFIRFGSW